MVKMNMIVNKSDLVGYEAVDRTEVKKKALAKIVAAWESKQAKNAARFGGLGFLAVSLAACNSSSDDTTTTTTTTTTTPATPTVTALSKDLATTADVITSTFTTANDTISATDTTFGAGDVLVDASSTDSDTLNITMAGNAMATAPATVTGIENINYNYGSNVTANETNINLGNIIGANVTVNHTGNALVAPNAAEIINIGPNMTVTLGTNIDTTTIDATNPSTGPFGGTESAMHVAASATNVTLNAGASALYVVTDASVDGLTINGGTGGAMTVAMGATSKNVSVNSGSGSGAVTVDLNSASTSSVTTAYTGTVAQTVAVNNIATAASVTVAKTGTAASATTINLDGTGSATDTASVTAAGIITFDSDAAQPVEILTLSGNGAAATYNLDAGAQPLSVTMSGSQSVTYKTTSAQALNHTTGITDSTTGSAVSTVQFSTAAATADYSKIDVDVIELQAATTGTNVPVFKDGSTLTYSTVAQANNFSVDVSDGLSTHNANGSLTINAGQDQTGVLTIDATASSDNIATLNFNMTANQSALDIRGGTATTVNITGSKTATIAGTFTAKKMDASGATGAIGITLGAGNKDIVLGSGDDTITSIAAPAAGQKVDGGAGNDKITIANASANANLTLSNIEVVDIAAANGKVTFKAS
jgi:hypothetical protein